jgi:hypothetical protein
MIICERRFADAGVAAPTPAVGPFARAATFEAGAPGFDRPAYPLRSRFRLQVHRDGAIAEITRWLVMAKEPERPRTKTILTGSAQPVTNSVERARGYLQHRPEPSYAPSATRKNFRKRKPEGPREENPAAQPRTDEAQSDSKGEGTSED